MLYKGMTYDWGLVKVSSMYFVKLLKNTYMPYSMENDRGLGALYKNPGSYKIIFLSSRPSPPPFPLHTPSQKCTRMSKTGDMQIDISEEI